MATSCTACPVPTFSVAVAPLTAGKGIPAYIHSDDRYRLADIIGSTFSMSREQLLSMTQGALELTEPEDVRVLHLARRLGTNHPRGAL